MDRAIEFWGSEDDERLTYTEMDDAIESILDGVDGFPETLEICGFARMELPSVESLSSSVLGRLMEDLDDEYGNPDGDSTEVPDSVIHATKEFVTIVLDKYVSWACDIVTRETIGVKIWIEAHRPDWLGKI